MAHGRSAVTDGAVAVIGTGAMGSRLAGRLLQTGHSVVVWNRSREKVRPLVALGAHAVASPGEATRRAWVVITMLADPTALRAVSEGADGIAQAAAPGQTLVEMSTVGTAAVHRLASRLAPGVGLLDAPVLGSLTEAESGTLEIFVGGERELFERERRLLAALGEPLHVGRLGCGAAAKLVANSTLFGVLGLLGEALVLARTFELSDDATHSVLARTPLAAQAEKRRAAIESAHYPLRFPLALARKDAALIVDAAAAEGLDLSLAEAQRDRLAGAERAGWGSADYSAVLSWLLERHQMGSGPTRAR